MTDPRAYAAWGALEKHAKEISAARLRDLFARDTERFNEFSVSMPGMLADFSKNKITDETLSLLVRLAKEANLERKREAMFSGDKINTTEDRAVLHTLLRADTDAEVKEVLARMGRLAGAVRDGSWKGHSGKEITDIVNIGIGGSSLGPQLATQALAHYHHPRLKSHFVANVEASDLTRTLAKISPETALFIVASKTFTTAETMQNAKIARAWLLAYYKGDDKAVARHFVAASTNAQAVSAFGINPENMFPFRDWVGGRYSVWSAIGISVMLMTGAENFDEFLKGAREMDAHFRAAPLEKNIPALMGLIGLWHRNFLHYSAYAVIPYHAQLARLPAFLQQLDMESNGKTAAVKTGPIVFGEPGTDAQHSFFQWLHQGTDVVPVDFIAAVKPSHGTKEQQTMLLANMLAQSEALMLGKENKPEPHRHFPGDRPSTTLLLNELTPRTLGTLLAAYEHKVFVQGAIWSINSFDQWGVELGKVMAKTLEAELNAGNPGAHDASTLGLQGYILKK